jgi:rare lipoprotein A
VGSWYGRRYHGQKTSSGEVYDMYAMTAAHPTLPIPSYARVTNLANGRSVVVRVNDRGPFHSERIVDLSYTAAYKLGFAANGSALVDLESIVPGTVVAAAPPPVAEERKPAEETAPDSPAEAKGVFVQLGAFAARDGAESFRARVYKELAWLSEAIHVYAADGLYKLQLGPYRTREDARPILERIRAELNFSPALVAR